MTLIACMLDVNVNIISITLYHIKLILCDVFVINFKVGLSRLRKFCQIKIFLSLVCKNTIIRLFGV